MKVKKLVQKDSVYSFYCQDPHWYLYSKSHHFASLCSPILYIKSKRNVVKSLLVSVVSTWILYWPFYWTYTPAEGINWGGKWQLGVLLCFFPVNQHQEVHPQANKLDRCGVLIFYFHFQYQLGGGNLVLWHFDDLKTALCILLGKVLSAFYLSFQFFIGSITKIIHILVQSSSLWEFLYGVTLKLLHLFPESQEKKYKCDECFCI